MEDREGREDRDVAALSRGCVHGLVAIIEGKRCGGGGLFQAWFVHGLTGLTPGRTKPYEELGFTRQELLELLMCGQL